MAGLNDIDTEEALALFAVPRTCEDDEGWLPQKQQADTWIAAAGVLNEDGSSARLLVELVFRRSSKTSRVWYKFTVFKRHASGLERAYQLDIQQFARQLPIHDRPHEHFGSERIEGGCDWATWTFEQALQHFTERTTITFRPPVPHPEHFELRG